MEKVKEKLIVLSDLWGSRKAFPLSFYEKIFINKYTFQYYDSSLLAGISNKLRAQTDLHNAFVNGGIDQAVTSLLKLEPDAQNILGFSVGGVIAWRYALQNPSVQTLTAISATRLRYESQKPNCPTQLLYGALDPYQPNAKWYRQMDISAQIIVGQGHDLYRNAELMNDYL